MLTAKSRIYIDIVNSDVGVTVTRNGGFKCELQKMDAFFLSSSKFCEQIWKKRGSTFFSSIVFLTF